MSGRRQIEIYWDGEPAGDEVLRVIEHVAGSGDDITVQNLRDPGAARRARHLGVHSTPALVIDGQLQDIAP